jgi:hypothetical protein
MGIAFAVTILFHANVDAQGGAYATGVLVLMTSAAIAVTIDVWRTQGRWGYLLIALVFVYTTGLNMLERPEGIKISSFFIFAIVAVSLISRAVRSTELRITDVDLDETARALLAEDEDQVIRLVARKPRVETEESLDVVDRQVRYLHGLSPEERIYFFEVERGDASSFECILKVTGQRLGRHSILRAQSPAVANAIAAVLLHLEKTTGNVPHGYFKWNEGNPVGNLFRFIFLGEGDTAPLAHEVLRRTVPDYARRPVIHVS